MKNYYDELEISKTASKEVIEKVYKVLAKKYHPDTTQESDKLAAEEKFKIISEAYEILSNDEKRKKYDLELERSNPSISYNDYMNIVKERDSLHSSLNHLKNSMNTQRTQPNQSTSTTYNTKYNTTYNTAQQYNNNSTTPHNKKHIYYNTVTGQKVSAFTYYKYKIKQFIQNIIFWFFFLIAFFLGISSFIKLLTHNPLI